LKSTGEKFDVRRRGSFLWTKHSGCVNEGCRDIARDSEINALETAGRTDGLHRSEPSIGCGGPAETDDDSTSAYCDCMEDEFSDSSSCCIERAVCIGPTGNLKTCGLRHFDNGGAAVESPSSIEWCPKRSCHPMMSVCSAKYLEESLTSVS
jgi:hypothetical protein